MGGWEEEGGRGRDGPVLGFVDGAGAGTVIDGWLVGDWGWLGLGLVVTVIVMDGWMDR